MITAEQVSQRFGAFDTTGDVGAVVAALQTAGEEIAETLGGQVALVKELLGFLEQAAGRAQARLTAIGREITDTRTKVTELADSGEPGDTPDEDG